MILTPSEVGLLLALGLLDEQRDGLALDRLVVGGALLREGLRRRLDAKLFFAWTSSASKAALLMCTFPTVGDVVRFQARAAAAAAPCEQGGDEDEQERECDLLHKEAPAKQPGARPA